jgi:hypothetical protein
LTIADFAVLARRNGAWTIAFAAHAFALGGVLLGIRRWLLAQVLRLN